MTWLAISDSIESVFGQYKTPTERGPLKDIGKPVLAIPAVIADLTTAPLVRQAMESVRTIDVEAWADQHLGPSILAKRRQALITPWRRHETCMNDCDMKLDRFNTLAVAYSRRSLVT